MGSCDNACRLQAHRYRLRADSVEDRSFLPTPLPLLLSTILSSCCLSALSPSLSACVATLSPTSFHVRPGSSLLTTGLSLSVSVCLSLSLTFSFSLSHPPLLFLFFPPWDQGRTQSTSASCGFSRQTWGAAPALCQVLPSGQGPHLPITSLNSLHSGVS